MDALLLNARETARLLGVSERTFHRLARLGHWRMCEVARPLGQRRYSRALVEQYGRGQTMNAFGRRRA